MNNEFKKLIADLEKNSRKVVCKNCGSTQHVQGIDNKPAPIDAISKCTACFANFNMKGETV